MRARVRSGTQDRQAVDSAFEKEIRHTVERRFIDPAILMEGGRGDRDHAL